MSAAAQSSFDDSDAAAREMGDKCFVPFTPDAGPCLDGHPIVVKGTADSAGAIVLSPVLLELAQRVLEVEFKREPEEGTLRVTALCTPQLGEPLAVDAAVRYLAHQFEADIVVLDAEDLANGERGVLGADFCTALWSLYTTHYDIKDDREALNPLQRKFTRAVAMLAGRHDLVQERAHALAEYARSKAAERNGSDSEDNDEELHGLQQAVANAENLVLAARADSSRSAEALRACKQDHAERATTRSAAHEFALAYIRECLKLDTPTCSRRRILYLRNFPAMSYGFAPLMPALLASEPGVVVLAGIWRAERLPRTDQDVQADPEGKFARKQAAFVNAFEDGTALMSYIARKFTPAWRQPHRTDRFEGLAETFTAGVMHRHYVRPCLRRHWDTEELEIDVDVQMEFAHALAIAVDDAPAAVTRSTRSSTARRLVTHNVQALQAALLSLGKQWTGPVIKESLDLLEEGDNSEAELLSASAKQLSEVVLALGHTDALAGRLLPWLPADLCVTTSDVFYAMRKSDEVARELRAFKDGPRKKTNADPSLVEKVKNADDLDDFEKRLLGAIVDPETISTTYADVCVQPHIVETLRSVVSLPLLYSEAYSTGILGRESMAGVLLYGPPGTGKTMLCRALAKESGARMLQIQASSIRSKWHSEDEKLIHATFTLARRLGPCVIFIDEIDALFGSRDTGTAIHRETLTEFLQEMDGLKSASENKTSKVVVVGATNRPQDLDDAILRRLPRRVLVDLPGQPERETIIRQYLTGETIDDAVDLPALAAHTEGYSGSDLKHVVFSAALAAFKDTVPDLWNGAGDAPKALEARVIGPHHFGQALQEIVATSAANVDALEALRNWGGSLGV